MKNEWNKILIKEQGGAKAVGRQLTYGEALKEALAKALAFDNQVYAMGQGINDPGAMFGSTDGLSKIYGLERVFDVPLSEEATVGMAIGSAMAGMRPVSIHNRPDFLLMAMDQIVNHAAKWSYMFASQVPLPLVIRACIGRGWGAAAQHSQALQNLFLQTPGLKIALPSCAFDAKGLLLSSIADNNPVLFFDHRWLYKQQEAVPEEMYFVPFGVARVRRVGTDITVVAISQMVEEALAAAEILQTQGISLEIIDPRTINPLDMKSIFASVDKTGRLLVADLASVTCGLSAEIISRVVEQKFLALKCAPARVAFPDTPIPASAILEKAFYPNAQDIVATAQRMMEKKHG